MDTATSNTGGGSAFASDSSTNLATVIKGLKKFDGKDPAEFKTWMKKFCVVLGVTRKDILPLLKKQRKPDPADTAAFDSYTRANEDLYAILFLLVELPAALSIQKHEDDTGISGDGQAAFEELCNNYDRVTDEVIRAKMEELENNPMNPGENPDDYFNQKHLLRTQLDKMGEPISDRRFKHICVQGFSDEYKDVKLMVFRDPTFNVLDMQSTMRNIFLDEQSRKGWKGRIAGRGFAMATTASDIICHGCYEPGHIRRNCPKIKNRAKKKTKPAGATKWCSKHNTTSHSDEECYQQGGKRPGDTKDSSKAFTACSNCTHCSSASNKHDSNNEVAVVDFTRDEDAFDSGFMFATCSRISGRNFAASSTGVGLLVDTGASETMFDNRLIPDGNLHDYTQRNSPKIVDVAGESQLKGTATGILHCTVKDNRGQRLRVRIQGLIVPGLGRNIFSPTSLLKKGLRCVVEESTPHLTIQGKVIPLTQDPRDQGMCTLDITFEQNVQPSGTKSLVPHQKQSQTHTANAVCFTLVSADTWHRRLGHLNARSLDILRKDTGTGVDYRDSLSPCGVCQIAKHKQSPHPKQSTRELSRPGQLVVIDNMGPVNPPAKYKGGSFPYACKITDDYTKMKEVYLLRKKSASPGSSGMRRLQVTRASTRGKPTSDDHIDVNLVPANLEVTMNDRGQAHATTGRVEPSGLSFTQLAEIADQAQLPCPGDTEDFAHVAEDPFTVPRAHAYVTTTHEHHGILEETNQAIKIPNTYDEAMSSPQREEWKEACSKEMDNLRKHNVYNLVPLSSVPKGEKILGTKFVFKKKLDGRFKARLVVGGHRQEPGQDYGRSYAPVCRIGSIRITCAIGCHNNWPIYQLDVVGAFLNALCDRDVYVRPAPGTSAKNSATGEPMVYKLERSLYGLSQSPALWNDTLNESLTVFGWKRTQSDPCVYVYTSGNIIVILTVYVDDILITGGDQQLVDQKKKELTDRFEMTDMGEVKRILGIDVQRDYEQGTLAISQEHYVNTLLERFGMQEANPVSTPGYGAEISTNQPQDQILGSTDKKIYQSMTGSILYLAQCTRFDLSYAALQLSKACSNPAQVNMTAAKHVLRYLRGNPVLPIVYKRGQFRLAAFTDSSFGANPDNGRSTTGYLFFLAGGPISYGAKTQTLTAQSTVEAEIQALSYSAREAVYISNFMTELNFKTFGSVPINSDSTGALTVAGNAMHSQRTKHVALRYFFIRELVLRGQITLHHRPSEHQLADIATKYLPKHRFASIIQQIKDFSC